MNCQKWLPDTEDRAIKESHPPSACQCLLIITLHTQAWDTDLRKWSRVTRLCAITIPTDRRVTFWQRKSTVPFTGPFMTSVPVQLSIMKKKIERIIATLRMKTVRRLLFRAPNFHQLSDIFPPKRRIIIGIVTAIVCNSVFVRREDIFAHDSQFIGSYASLHQTSKWQ